MILEPSEMPVYKERMPPILIVKFGVAIFLLLTSAGMSLMVAYRQDVYTDAKPMSNKYQPGPMPVPPISKPKDQPEPQPEKKAEPQVAAPGPFMERSMRKLQPHNKTRENKNRRFWKPGKIYPKVVIKSHSGAKDRPQEFDVPQEVQNENDRLKRYIKHHPFGSARYVPKKYLHDKTTDTKNSLEEYPGNHTSDIINKMAEIPVVFNKSSIGGQGNVSQENISNDTKHLISKKGDVFGLYNKSEVNTNNKLEKSHNESKTNDKKSIEDSYILFKEFGVNLSSTDLPKRNFNKSDRNHSDAFLQYSLKESRINQSYEHSHKPNKTGFIGKIKNASNISFVDKFGAKEKLQEDTDGSMKQPYNILFNKNFVKSHRNHLKHKLNNSHLIGNSNNKSLHEDGSGVDHPGNQSQRISSGPHKKHLKHKIGDLFQLLNKSGTLYPNLKFDLESNKSDKKLNKKINNIFALINSSAMNNYNNIPPQKASDKIVMNQSIDHSKTNLSRSNINHLMNRMKDLLALFNHSSVNHSDVNENYLVKSSRSHKNFLKPKSKVSLDVLNKSARTDHDNQFQGNSSGSLLSHLNNVSKMGTNKSDTSLISKIKDFLATLHLIWPEGYGQNSKKTFNKSDIIVNGTLKVGSDKYSSKNRIKRHAAENISRNLKLKENYPAGGGIRSFNSSQFNNKRRHKKYDVENNSLGLNLVKNISDELKYRRRKLAFFNFSTGNATKTPTLHEKYFDKEEPSKNAPCRIKNGKNCTKYHTSKGTFFKVGKWRKPNDALQMRRSKRYGKHRYFRKCKKCRKYKHPLFRPRRAKKYASIKEYLNDFKRRNLTSLNFKNSIIKQNNTIAKKLDNLDKTRSKDIYSRSHTGIFIGKKLLEYSSKIPANDNDVIRHAPCRIKDGKNCNTYYKSKGKIFKGGKWRKTNHALQMRHSKRYGKHRYFRKCKKCRKYKHPLFRPRRAKKYASIKEYLRDFKRRNLTSLNFKNSIIKQNNTIAKKLDNLNKTHSKDIYSRSHTGIFIGKKLLEYSSEIPANDNDVIRVARNVNNEENVFHKNFTNNMERIRYKLKKLFKLFNTIERKTTVKNSTSKALNTSKAVKNGFGTTHSETFDKNTNSSSNVGKKLLDTMKNIFRKLRSVEENTENVTNSNNNVTNVNIASNKKSVHNVFKRLVKMFNSFKNKTKRDTNMIRNNFENDSLNTTRFRKNLDSQLNTITKNNVNKKSNVGVKFLELINNVKNVVRSKRNVDNNTKLNNTNIYKNVTNEGPSLKKKRSDIWSSGWLYILH